MDSTHTTLSLVEDQMSKVLKILAERLAGLRAGRASPSLLEPLLVEAYGGRMPLSQLGTVSAPEARMLSVHVWDGTVVSAVDKAIQAFGLTPMVEGTTLRVMLPELTHDRRQELVKKAKEYAESARVSVRNLRRSFLEDLKDQGSEDHVHHLKKEVQKITDTFIEKVDAALVEKEKGIFRV